MASAATSQTRYEPVVGWPAVPHGIWFREATSVGVGMNGLVYVFGRGQWPMTVFDTAGRFLTTWGAGEFVHPHAIAFDPEGNLYLTDDGAHTVQKRTPDGTLLLQIGERGKLSPAHSGLPFNRPTQVAVHPRTGELFISPHGIAVDGEGSIYVAEVSLVALGSRLTPPQEVVSLRKWRRVDGGTAEGGMPDAAIPGYLAGLRYDGPGSGVPINSRYAL